MLNSTLFDERTFYQTFIPDLENCNEEVFIESPYITSKRVEMLTPVFKNTMQLV
jgi:hypothetical protein